MIHLQKAAELAGGTTTPHADVVVVCDPDPSVAAQAADNLADQRTAIFVGDLDDPADRRAAEEFARELEGGLRPGNSS